MSKGSWFRKPAASLEKEDDKEEEHEEPVEEANDDMDVDNEEQEHVDAPKRWWWSSDGKKGDGSEKSDRSDKSDAEQGDSGLKSALDAAKNDVKDARDVRKTSTNTILNSEESVPFRVKPSDKSDSEEQSDAVLYRPHDSEQLTNINTHKNENLRENVIVPDWRSCLHHQNYSTANNSGLFGGQAQVQSFDFKNLRTYLSLLSLRFRFGSSLKEAAAHSEVEKELTSIYEHSYRFYGRSLAKLPHHKRGCMPFSEEISQAEEETVSVSNDAMGNLLINHRKPAKSETRRKIKNILIIGVHGFFPRKMIRPIIGAPKGTSLKFANEAEKAVIRYCVENDLLSDETNSISIQKIALEKEAKIFDRVEFFTRILTRWSEELNNADFIYFASHSQGCVVLIILLARLIEEGVLKNPLQKRIGLLGMAGVNNGPFYGIDNTLLVKAYSAIEHDSLLELFELSKFDSEQLLAYKLLMQTIVSANVKICLIGSINDQLVPLFSALASHIFHPNIYRACYIDHSLRTPDFMRRLVGICCRLQNLGYFDNNVIKEVSSVLAGPITGGGHSKIYNDGKVYDLGIKFALDTEDVVLGPQPASQIYTKEFNISKIGTNPFILPWCLRGLIFNVEKNWPVSNSITMEAGQPKTGPQEIEALYELFDKWRPDSKVLKDLKFRLNGIRASKL